MIMKTQNLRYYTAGLVTLLLLIAGFVWRSIAGFMRRSVAGILVLCFISGGVVQAYGQERTQERNAIRAYFLSLDASFNYSDFQIFPDCPNAEKVFIDHYLNRSKTEDVVTFFYYLVSDNRLSSTQRILTLPPACAAMSAMIEQLMMVELEAILASLSVDDYASARRIISASASRIAMSSRLVFEASASASNAAGGRHYWVGIFTASRANGPDVNSLLAQAGIGSSQRGMSNNPLPQVNTRELLQASNDILQDNDRRNRFWTIFDSLDL